MIAERFSMTDRVALVTGAGSGLGRRFALTLAEAGAHVALAGRREAPLVETAEMIAAATSVNTAVVTMDVTSVTSISEAFDGATEALGTPTIIVNNAGISREAFALEYSDEDYHAVIDTNLNGVFRVAREAGQRLVAANSPGSVINIASILGRRVQYMLSAYSAAKAGVIRLTESLALEWVRYGIRVNAIAPGFFVTDINREFFETQASEHMLKRIPMRRPGEIDELSGALLLLASDAGAYMTGSTITVDGGHVCNPL